MVDVLFEVLQFALEILGFAVSGGEAKKFKRTDRVSRVIAGFLLLVIASAFGVALARLLR